MEPTNGKKTNLIVLALIILVVIAIVIWLQGSQTTPVPTTSITPTATTQDQTISGMQSAAASVDTGNLDQEFAPINSDVNSL